MPEAKGKSGPQEAVEKQNARTVDGLRDIVKGVRMFPGTKVSHQFSGITGRSDDFFRNPISIILSSNTLREPSKVSQNIQDLRVLEVILDEDTQALLKKSPAEIAQSNLPKVVEIDPTGHAFTLRLGTVIDGLDYRLRIAASDNQRLGLASVFVINHGLFFAKEISQASEHVSTDTAIEGLRLVISGSATLPGITVEHPLSMRRYQNQGAMVPIAGLLEPESDIDTFSWMQRENENELIKRLLRDDYDAFPTVPLSDDLPTHRTFKTKIKGLYYHLRLEAIHTWRREGRGQVTILGPSISHVLTNSQNSKIYSQN